MFENPVPTVRGDIVGGGGNLLIDPQTNGSYPKCTPTLIKKINDENLHLFYGGKKQIKRKITWKPLYDAKYY